MIGSRRVLWLCLCAWLGTTLLQAQVPGGALCGRVLDARSGDPLPGASIVLLPSTPAIGTTTDSAGHFLLTDIPVGYYTLQVAFVGYTGRQVPDLWVRAGKRLVQEVALEPALHDLGTFTVSALAREVLPLLGARPLTVEQSLRYPAMFFDPARVAATSGGVLVANDQANHLVIRGNSPNANACILEGAEIVNPNHLSNAGTLSDYPTLSGGGVNILSAQMLGTSRFLAGGLPMDRGNATGGVLDMSLRPGSTSGQEWTAQAGLIGIDLATEGPFRKGGRSSYLINYRYSTLGLLGAMGVDLGDESITFQDLSFHVAVPFKRRGELRVFGLGGTSRNTFEAVRDTNEWAYDKDNKDVTYTGRMGAAGATLSLPVGEKGLWRTTAVLSATEQIRREVAISPELLPGDTFRTSIEERKLSLVSGFEGAVGMRFRYGVGLSAMERAVTNLLRQDAVGWLLRPYAFGRWAITERVQVEAGLGWSHFTFNSSAAWEPRASVQGRVGARGMLAASYGWRSMLPWQQVTNLYLTPQIVWNEAVGLWRSEDIAVGYRHQLTERARIHFEAFHQRMIDVPVDDPSFSFAGASLNSGVNVWDAPVYIRQVMTGHARTIGLEASLTRDLSNGMFYQVGGTLYEALEERGGAWKDTRWNGGYILNALGGNEWRREKEDRVRTWGVSLRVLAAGGLRYTPIIAGRRGFVYAGEPWSARLRDVFRMDVRVYLKKDRKGRTGMWAIDLQNLTNSRNEAYIYYDFRQSAAVTKYQLGLIPNLSYRIEF